MSSSLQTAPYTHRAGELELKTELGAKQKQTNRADLCQNLTVCQTPHKELHPS